MKKHTLLLLFSFLTALQASAQWQLAGTDTTKTTGGIAFYGSDTGYTSSHYMTTDGGQTWQKNTAWDKYNSYIQYAVHTLKPGVLMLTGLPNDIISYDNGKSWDTMQFPHHFLAYLGNHYYNDSTVVIWDNSGSFYKSTDNGLNWKTLVERNSRDCIYFDKDEFIVTEGGYVLLLDDTAKHFKDTINLKYLSPVTAMTVSPDKVWFFAQEDMHSSDSQIYFMTMSNDTGKSWQIVDTLASKVNAVFFTSKDTGYTIGDEGVIYRTVNGGLHWEKQATPTTANLSTFYTVSSSHVVVGGEKGTVLYTFNSGYTRIKPEAAPELPVTYYPNPGNGVGFISLQSGKNMKITVSLLSRDGKMVQSRHFQAVAGRNKWQIEWPADLKPGMYFMRITGEDSEEANIPVIINR